MIDGLTEYESLVAEVEQNQDFADWTRTKIGIGYDRLNYGIDDRLMAKMGRSSKNTAFYRNHIYGNKNDYSLIICDENDISSDDKSKLLYKKANTKCLFIIMVCPTKMLKEVHDVHDIPSIIREKSEISGFPVGITTESSFAQHIKRYMSLIEKYVMVKHISFQIESRINSLESVLASLANNDSDLFQKMYIWWSVQSIKKSLKKLYDLGQECEAVLKKLEADYYRYSIDCKSEIAEEIFHKANVGDWAADIAFKYGGIQNLFSESLNVLKDSQCSEDDAFKLTVSNCITRLDEKPQVAFVGNFSSGKTSFINWILSMEGNRQLRTSGKHNTAILTSVKYGNPERVVVEYKKSPDLFQWKLLDVEYEKQFADYYRGEKKAIVTAVDDEKRIVKYRYQGKSKYIVLQNKSDRILVKKNDVLRHGMQLTEGARDHVDMPKPNANIKLCNVEEYKEIIKSINNQSLTNCTLIISYVSQKNVKQRLGAETKTIEKNASYEILKFLSLLESISSEIGTNISFNKLEENGGWSHNEVFNFPENVNFIYDVVIKGECNFGDTKEELNEKTWIKYGGSGKEGENVFTETPKCYLYASQITYYLNKGFLNYSDIIDTPGLGSVSGEHDAITERYIRKNVSNLLVMIRIDKNGKDRKKRKFIIDISSIYDDSNRDKNTVFFVCNIWSKDYGTSDLRELERICDYYYNDIIEYGFSKDNFYVIDILKMQAGYKNDEIFKRYQSAEVFRGNFIERIANDGIKQQLKKIDNEIVNLFIMQIKTYEKIISEIRGNALEKEIKIEKLNLARKHINKIEFKKTFEELFFENEVLQYLSDLSSQIRNLSYRHEWIKFASEVLVKNYGDDNSKDELDAIESLCTDPDDVSKFEDKIATYYVLLIEKIKRIIVSDLDYDNTHPICVYIENEKSEIRYIGMGSFPFNDFKKRIKAQRDHFESIIRFIHNTKVSKRDAEEISNYIDQQIEKCRQENLKNYNLLIGKFNDIKNAALSNICKQIDSFSVDSDEGLLVCKYEDNIRELTSLQDKWTRTISNTVLMKEILA
ncbi:hypothetical protein [Butyrivibrio sp. VCB2006]|uniref:hypothetical protein n=1 Tax=Butyrivibrio sp. VCB2006 TaxID=1280679 RepID=UPI000418257C|nr:hypothetical protein [Butyrivibrio sp. VCB2006]